MKNKKTINKPNQQKWDANSYWWLCGVKKQEKIYESILKIGWNY